MRDILLEIVGIAESYVALTEAVEPVPPFALNDTVYFLAVQCAYTVALPVHTVLAVTCVPPDALVYHPAKSYPVRVGVANVPYAESYVICLLVGDTAPPFALYVSVYVFAVQLALYVLSPLDPFAIVTLVCAVVPLEPVHPANI